jgi:hypothetical protein
MGNRNNPDTVGLLLVDNSKRKSVNFVAPGIRPFDSAMERIGGNLSNRFLDRGDELVAEEAPASLIKKRRLNEFSCGERVINCALHGAVVALPRTPRLRGPPLLCPIGSPLAGARFLSPRLMQSREKHTRPRSQESFPQAEPERPAAISAPFVQAQQRSFERSIVRRSPVCNHLRRNNRSSDALA